MIDFSVLLPTRGRPVLVKRLLDSIVKTASNSQNIEIVLYVDEDDLPSHQITHDILSIVKLIRPSGEPMGGITRACYEASTGRYIMLMNDDVVFRTEHWDVAVRDVFAQFPDDMAFVYGNDLDQGEKVPSFPILSRKACEVMGEICPRGYLNFHIESHLLDIFRQLSRLGYDRIVYLKDVIFEHLHHVVGKAEMDATYLHKKDLRADDQLYFALRERRQQIALKLANQIKVNNAQATTNLNLLEKELVVRGEEMPLARADQLTWNLSLRALWGWLTHSHHPISTVQPEVSIIIPMSPHSPNFSFRWLQGIVSMEKLKTPFEVIIAADHDLFLKAASHLQRLSSAITVAQVEEGASFTRACNQAMKEARGEYLVFLSRYAVPKIDWLDTLVGAARAGDNVAIVGCKVLHPRTGGIVHAGIGFFEESGQLRLSQIYRGFKPDHPAVNRQRRLQAVSITGMLVKKQAFLETGGFDESLQSDRLAGIDLCLRIHERDMKIIYTPDAVLYHDQNEESAISMPHSQEMSHLMERWGKRVRRDLCALLEEDGFSLHRLGDTFYVEGTS